MPMWKIRILGEGRVSRWSCSPPRTEPASFSFRWSSVTDEPLVNSQLSSRHHRANYYSINDSHERSPSPLSNLAYHAFPQRNAPRVRDVDAR